MTEHPAFIRITTVPGDEELHQVDVINDQAADQGQLGDLVDVAQGDDLFQTAPFAERNQKHQHHAKAAEHGSDHEIQRENRGMPAGNLRRTEVQTDDGTHRKDQQRTQTAEHEVGLFIMMPLAGRTGPTHRQEGEDTLADAGGRTIAQHGKIRNHAHEKEQGRNRQVGVHGEHVPHERRTELRPEAVGIRHGEHEPVEPGAADMNGRIQTRHHDGENGHRLSHAADGGAPMLTRQEQERGNQRAGMGHADPPDEVHDVQAPHHRVVVAPNADARKHLVEQAGREDDRGGKRGGDEQNPPPERRLAFGERGQLVRKPAEALIVFDHRGAPQFRRRGQGLQLVQGVRH